MLKVSIIVPVYGVEKFIERCARSLFEQTYQDLEFIFVDDCTNDRSIDVLDRVMQEYPNRRKQVRILHHTTNKGLPQARKSGILAAEGEYIISVDSDDWVDLSMVDVLVKRVKKEDSEIVIFDYATTNGIDYYNHKGCFHLEKESLIRDLCPMKVSWSLCNKMFKKTLINNEIVFPNDNMGEDMGLTMQLVLKSSLFSYEPSTLYYYYLNPNSISQVLSEKAILNKYLQHNNNLRIVIDAFEKMGVEEEYKDCLVALKWNVRKGLWPLVNHTDYYRMWKNTYPEIDLTILFNSLISIEDKVRYLLTRIHLYPQKKNRV